MHHFTRRDIYFQANIVIFTGLVFIVGILMGIGKAAVYKHIPDYFPQDVGTVGGIVGVLGGLGGFVGPILFGYLLDWTGVWTTSWMFLFAVAVTCLLWMHIVIRRMIAAHAPAVANRIEEPGTAFTAPVRARCTGWAPECGSWCSGCGSHLLWPDARCFPIIRADSRARDTASLWT